VKIDKDIKFVSFFRRSDAKMDLTKDFPRSPYDMMGGMVMVPRTFDKCKATIEGTNGEYHYGCPMDEKVFGFLGVSVEEFKKKVEELGDEDKFEEWVGELKPKEEKYEFNNKMRHDDGSDNEEKKNWLEEQKKALGKEASFTFFDNLDADEKRF
jgi:hypothetical protein